VPPDVEVDWILLSWAHRIREANAAVAIIVYAQTAQARAITLAAKAIQNKRYEYSCRVITASRPALKASLIYAATAEQSGHVNSRFLWKSDLACGTRECVLAIHRRGREKLEGEARLSRTRERGPSS
jgi:hypothetical protein